MPTDCRWQTMSSAVTAVHRHAGWSVLRAWSPAARVDNASRDFRRSPPEMVVRASRLRCLLRGRWARLLPLRGDDPSSGWDALGRAAVRGDRVRDAQCPGPRAAATLSLLVRSNEAVKLRREAGVLPSGCPSRFGCGRVPCVPRPGRRGGERWHCASGGGRAGLGSAWCGCVAMPRH